MSDYVVKQFPKGQWQEVSESAYAAAFGHFRAEKTLRYDFALLTVRAADDVPVGYTTATELSDELVQWRFGGGFEPVKGRPAALRALAAMIDWHRGRYKGIVTTILNTNLPSLKIHLAAGFIITGVQHIEGETFVILHLKLEA